MINYLYSRLYRPERGWDPIDSEYAQQYTMRAWNSVDNLLITKVEQLIGGFTGKEVLDLGGGPGQYSVAFAKRGAIVTWHDVSRNYLRIAEQKAKEAGVSIIFSLGYMDEAPLILKKQYDLVFSRVCFYYGWDDRSFVGVIYNLMRPSGYAYIETHNSSYKWSSLSLSVRFRTWLNAVIGLKIGHPHPPRGRIPTLFLKYPIQKLIVEYPTADIDRIFVQKGER